MPRTPEQDRAVTARAKTISVDAGAGSGKTRVLVERIVTILAQREARLDEIVAITFTDKAAAEMKERLRAAFRAQAPEDDPAGMSYWRDLEQRVEAARVSTIHSFCSSVLRENALRIGLDPDFSVLTESENRLLRDTVIADTLHTLYNDGHGGAMHAAVTTSPSSLERQMTALIAQRGLVDEAAKTWPLEDPAALVQRWRETVRVSCAENLGRLRQKGVFRTLHAELSAFDGACKKPKDPREVLRAALVDLLTQLEQALDLDPLLDAFSPLTAFSLRGARKDAWDSPETAEEVSAIIENARELFEKIALPESTPENEGHAAELTKAVYTTYVSVRNAYQQAKSARIAMDFDDLITTTVQVLRENAQIRARVASGIQHLLIDEFQDTDAIQLEIARLLTNEPGGPSLFVVGDAKQSIYDFRGAEVEGFQTLKKTSDVLIPLDTNFRTANGVMAFINDFFAATNLLEAVEPVYHPLIAHRPGTESVCVEFVIPEPCEGAIADDYRRMEAELIAARLQTLCGGGPGSLMLPDAQPQSFRPAGFGDVAILLRSLGDVHLYEEPLRRANIPYQVIAGRGFFERQEIRDLHNLLTLLTDPWNETALIGFLRGPFAALSDDALVRLTGEKGLPAAFYSRQIPQEMPSEQAQRIEAAHALLDALRLKMEWPLPVFLRYVLEHTGFEAILLSQFLGVQKASNVRKVIDLARDFSQSRSPRLPEFVRYLESLTAFPEIREGDATLATGETGSVTIMTIHKSKGLEFPIVVVADAARGLHGSDATPILTHRHFGLAAKPISADGESYKPAIYEMMTRDKAAMAEAEHARILYVAMTRARDYLILSGGLKPMRKAWWLSFNDCYHILETPHNTKIAGDAWRARVIRQAEAVTTPRSSEPLAPCPSWDMLERQAAPPAMPRPPAVSISVSRLLDAMGFDHDDAVAWDDEPVPDTPKSGLPENAAQRGTRIHAFFEQWDFQSDPSPLITQLCQSTGVNALSRDAAMADMQAIVERMRTAPICSKLAQVSRSHKEIPFLLRFDAGLVTGTIDAMLPDGALVDYKTGMHRPETQLRYTAQLALYAEAARRLCGREVPNAYICYLDTGEVVPVDVTGLNVAAILTRAQETLAYLMPPKESG